MSLREENSKRINYKCEDCGRIYRSRKPIDVNAVDCEDCHGPLRITGKRKYEKEDTRASFGRKS